MKATTPPSPADGWDAALRWAEFGLCLAVTAFLVVCHVTLLQHIGALWRDETQMVNLALSPTFADYWRDLNIDTFPVLWPALVHGWSWIAGPSDFGLRLLGLFVGLSILAAAWWCAWQAGRGFPLLTLAMFALAPTVIYYGDTLRGYGLGLVCLLLMYGVVWRAVCRPGAGWIGLALLAALLAVHSMYFNAVLLLAVGVSAAAVSLRRWSWKPVVIVAGIGIASAISLLLYLDPLSRQRQWNAIIKYQLHFKELVADLTGSVNASGRPMVWVWLVLFALAVAACAWNFARRKGGMEELDRDRGVWAGTGLVAGIAAYIAFLLAASQPPHVWYYMPLMAFLAVSLDVAFESTVLAHWRGRAARLLAVVVVVVLGISPAWQQAHERITNVDLIANFLKDKAGKDDLIVISPWWPSVSFNRYYHGDTPWTTLPEMGHLRMQRYDLFKQRMEQKDDPIRPVLDRMEATLRAGHRVWLMAWRGLATPREARQLSAPGEPLRIGWAGLTMPPNERLRLLPPATPGKYYKEGVYQSVWDQQATLFLLLHCRGYGPAPVAAPDPVCFFENQTLFDFEGWH